MRPTLDDEGDLEPWDDDPDGPARPCGGTAVMGVVQAHDLGQHMRITGVGFRP